MTHLYLHFDVDVDVETESQPERQNATSSRDSVSRNVSCCLLKASTNAFASTLAPDLSMASRRPVQKSFAWHECQQQPRILCGRIWKAKGTPPTGLRSCGLFRLLIRHKHGLGLDLDGLFFDLCRGLGKGSGSEPGSATTTGQEKEANRTRSGRRGVHKLPAPHDGELCELLQKVRL